MSSGPNPFAALNGDRQDWDSGFQSHAYRAGFEFLGGPVRIPAAALGENHDGPALAYPLQRAPDRCGIGTFQLQRPGAKRAQKETDYRPAKGRVPREKSNRTSHLATDPEWIDVGLVIRRDN